MLQENSASKVPLGEVVNDVNINKVFMGKKYLTFPKI